MAIEDKIIKLEPDDIISDSMNKINHNFKIIEFSERVFEEKLQSFSKRYEKELEDLRSNCNSDNANILNSINNLSDKIYTTYDNSNIQDAVNNAILNADQELINFIRDKAGEQISASMNDYAKKSSLNELSSAFTQYKADEKTKQASVNTIVSNSRYCRDSEGRLCYLNGTSSGYKTLEEYYANGLSAAEKATVNGSSTDGLSDPDVLERFLKLCETTFKTEFKELSSIISSVGGGVSKTSIVNAVRGSGNLSDDENIIAAIFVEANEHGSSIKLNADQLNFTGHNITLSSGEGTNDFRFQLSENGLTVNTTNFKLDGSGNLTVKGTIEANNGKVGGLIINNDGSLTNGNFTLSSTGKLTATDAEISGKITATSGKIGTLTINDSGLNVGNTIFIGNDTSNGESIIIEDNSGNKSILSSNGLQMTGSFKLRTAYLVTDLGEFVWDGEEEETEEKIHQIQEMYDIYETSKASELFNKYDVVAICMTGNVTLPNNSNYIGRKITFIHGHPVSNKVREIIENSGLSYSYSLGGSYADCKFNDTSCNFYEDGGSSKNLHLSNEGVDMIGIGIGNTFMGFMILRRFNITTEKEYGHELRCLGMFKVTSSNGLNISSKTYSGQNASIGIDTNSNYFITTPFKITNTDNVFVTITSEGQSGITYGYDLDVDSTTSRLKIIVRSSNLSKPFKMAVFNFGDFSSLSLNSWS